MAATDAMPVPRKNVAYRVYFPILDADGDFVTGAAALDSEASLDGAAFADCTNEATEIGSSGVYYLDLTSSEMNADAVVVQVKTSTSGAKTTPIILYPQETGDIKVDVTSFGGTAGTFASGRPEVNMTHIAGSAVSTSTAQLGVNVVNFGGSAGTFSSGRPEVNTTHWGGTAVASATVRSDLINIAGVAVSTSTAQLGVNVVSISGDSVAADNLEAAADGTGYNLGSGQIVAASVTGAVGSVTSSVTVGTNNDKTGYSLTATTGLGNQTANITGSLSGSVGSVTGNVGGNVAGSVGSLATQAKADVNAEVLDVLATDTFTEPTGVVAATSSLKDKINWLFALMRNKRTQTSSTETLYRDDGSTTTATSTKSDDGTTYTRGEWT